MEVEDDDYERQFGVEVEVKVYEDDDKQLEADHDDNKQLKVIVEGKEK